MTLRCSHVLRFIFPQDFSAMYFPPRGVSVFQACSNNINNYAFESGLAAIWKCCDLPQEKQEGQEVAVDQSRDVGLEYF